MKEAEKLRRLSTRTLKAVAHELFPGPNKSQHNYWNDIPSSIELTVTLPYPLKLTTRQNFETDISLERIKDYNQYTQTYAKFHGNGKTTLSKKLYKKHVRKNIYPHIVFRFIEMAEKNPDPFFSGNYDWYFTGGNLLIFDIQENQSILNVDGDNLVISDLQLNQNNKNHYETIENNKIIIVNKSCPFELQAQEFGNDYFLSIRQKHSISIYTNFRSKPEPVKIIRNNYMPFISTCFNPDDIKDFITTNLNGQVLLWDMNKPDYETVLFERKKKFSNQNWNIIRYLSNNIYAFANSNEYFFLDTREDCTKITHSKSISPEYGPCDNITILNKSNFENLLYIATMHKLYAFDIRYFNNTINENNKLILEWTHQMNSAPCFLDTKKVDCNEIIVMSSQINGDVRLCTNNKLKIEDETENKFVSYLPPYKFPAISDSIMNAKSKGKILDPSVNLQRRINYCTTGLCLNKNASNLSIFTGNSLGDIYCNNYIDKNKLCEFEEYSLDILEYWHNKILENSKQHPNPLVATRVENFEKLQQIFCCKRVNKLNFKEPKSKYRPMKWEISPRELLDSKDSLTYDILLPWKIQIENENPSDLETFEFDESIQKSQRVDKWVEEVLEVVIGNKPNDYTDIKTENIIKEPE